MVDITKYKNVSLPKDTYNTITKLQKVMVPDATISRTQVINILVEKERKKTKWQTQDLFNEDRVDLLNHTG